MTVLRPAAGRFAVLCCALAISLSLTAPATAQANGEFPFDREMLLDVAPMRPVKRVPILAVAPDGAAVVDLWCKTVNARVIIAGDTLRIEPGPLPEALPAMMVAGQCSPERMEADASLLADLAQVGSWKRQGEKVTLNGAKTLRFRLSSH
jgi:hypothetical protein